METNDRNSGLAPRTGAPLASNDAPPPSETRAIPRAVVVRADGPAPAANVPAQVAALLLPGERAGLVSSSHPILFVPHAFGLAAAILVVLVLENWKLSAVVHGHHTLVPLLHGPAAAALVWIGGIAALGEVAALIRCWAHYASFRVVATNRRIFVVDGLFNRIVTPLANTALAGSTLAQGIVGRIFGFGTIVLPQTTGGRRVLTGMRSPVELYRECQAVANGVDGDTWTPAVRQTIIP